MNFISRPHPLRKVAAVATAALLACTGAGVLEASGVTLGSNAVAATSDTTTVTVTVLAAMSVTNGCSGTSALSVNLGSLAYSGACAISYGATNDATQKLTIEDNDGAAPFLGTIPDTASDCAALSATDSSGVHITGTSGSDSTIMAGWATSCTTAATAGTNTKFRAVPASAVDACQSNTTSVTTHSCSFEWGVRESGSDLAAGSYVGTAKFTVVDI